MSDTHDIFLRKVTADDCDLLYKWANDPLTRKNAFSTESIPYTDHTKWFKNKLNDNDELFFIMMHGAEPVGQIRLSVDNGNAYIDYSIAPEKRGCGYGTKICALALDKIRSEYPYIKKLTAQVKPENTASAKCFEKNGFKPVFTQFEIKLPEI